MNENTKIFIVISKYSKKRKYVKENLKEFDYKIFESFNRAYYSVYATPPVLIIYFIEKELKEESFENQLKLIYNMQLDSMLRNIPILFVIPDGFKFRNPVSENISGAGKSATSYLNFYIKDYIKEPLLENEFSYKVNSILHSATSALDSNPLTRLPGNSSIMEAVNSRLKICSDMKANKEHSGGCGNDFDFSFLYIDIDNFKSFNDKYGFIRGDEVIMMTSRLIATTTYDISNDRKRDTEKYVFIGHIGGDDFTVISHNDDAADIANSIINNFDKIITSFYDSSDRERGHIETYDRKNRLCQFPLMTLSIALIPKACKKIKHYGQLSEIASALKSSAKKQDKSVIMIDKRQE